VCPDQLQDLAGARADRRDELVERARFDPRRTTRTYGLRHRGIAHIAAHEREYIHRPRTDQRSQLVQWRVPRPPV
jgi:hypothetical protein